MKTYNNIDILIENLRKLYLSDNRIWVITFSGGKDSTFLLHLVILMLLQLKKENIRTRKIYILSSDTRVEMPIMEAYHFNKMRQIKQFIEQENLNVEIELVQPEIKDDFFVCLLGKGYPSPNLNFRWCTKRIKISGTEKYLNSIIEKHSSIVMLLGVRNDESITREQSIKKREFNEKDFVIHDNLPNAYTFSPIKDILTSELWDFLSSNKAPWGTHEDMMALYDKGSGEADCNIMLHPNSESCGKTRFGCWVCTVIEKDSSMENAIKNGETWQQPYLDYRNKLYTYRYDHSKRRDKMKLGKLIPGAFYLEVRKELLRDLFEVEKEVASKLEIVTGKRTLLTDEQILAINKEHRNDGDFCNDALKIANEYGRSFEIIDTKINDDVKSICEKNQLDPCFIDEMLKINYKHRHSMKRLGIKKEQNELITAYIQGVVHEDK
jgi:DNA sulfur modification protein DndC